MALHDTRHSTKEERVLKMVAASFLNSLSVNPEAGGSVISLKVG